MRFPCTTHVLSGTLFFFCYCNLLQFVLSGCSWQLVDYLVARSPAHICIYVCYDSNLCTYVHIKMRNFAFMSFSLFLLLFVFFFFVFIYFLRFSLTVRFARSKRCAFALKHNHSCCSSYIHTHTYTYVYFLWKQSSKLIIVKVQSYLYCIACWFAVAVWTENF